MWLPAYSSHLSQPLDVNIFVTLKRKYRALMDDLVILTDADNLTKEDFLACSATSCSYLLILFSSQLRIYYSYTGIARKSKI